MTKPISLISVAFLMLAHLSCVKDTEHESIHPSPVGVQASAPVIVDPSNSLNPFDYAGLAHNQLLDDYIHGYMIPTQTENDPAEVFEYFGTDQDGRNTILAFRDYDNADPDDYPADLHAFYISNTEVFTFYFELRAIVNDEQLDLADKLSEIKQFEQSYDYTVFSGDQVEIVKKTASIARYSLYYWAPVNQGGLGNYDIIVDGIPTKVDWWGVGRADIYGAALAGFATANPFAALGWGVVSSAIDALDEYFN